MIWLLLFIVFSMIFYVGSKSQSGAISDNRITNTANNSTLVDFKPDIEKKIAEYSFLISKENKKMAIQYDGVYRSEKPIILNIKDISNVEIVQDGSMVKSGAIGRSFVGGIIAGGIGAFIGAYTAKQVEEINSIDIKFTTTNADNPIIRVALYGKEEKVMRRAYRETHSPEAIYKLLEDLIALLNII